MFLDNKYHAWYRDLVLHAQQRRTVESYTERHHIIPRSMGGSNDTNNLVRFTAREHFVAHWLLTKFTTGQDKKRMVLALHAMTRSSKNQQRVAVGARQYARIREQVSAALSGAGNPNYGKTHSEETRRKMGERVLETRAKNGPVRLDAEAREKIAASKRGKPRPQWLKDQWSRVRKGRPGQNNNQGKRWWNDGQRSVLSKESPPGFVPGRLPLNSKSD